MQSTLFISVIFMIFVSSSLIFYGISLESPTPTVKTSYSTGKCVEVINYTEETKYSCNNLPKKYNHVWVK